MLTPAEQQIQPVETLPLVLRVVGAERSYGPVRALNGVDFDLRAGEVHALVGENGAGKSTLIKVISGAEQLNGGSIDRFGNDIAVVHQELAVVPTLSVLENLFLGSRALSGWLKRKALHGRAAELLASVGLDNLPLNAPASALSLAQRQLLEVARALGRNASIIILDEPTATLTDVEVDRVLTAVRTLRDRGNSIVYVSHRMQEIYALADRVTTLRNGALVSTDDMSDLRPGELVHKMLGQELTDYAAHEGVSFDPASQPALSVQSLTADRKFEDVSFTVRTGEICCLTGQIGSGADAVVRALAGLQSWTHGEVQLHGLTVAPGSVQSSRKAGSAYVPADRAKEGVFLQATVTENISSGVLRSLSTAGWVSRSEESRQARSTAKVMSIRDDRMLSLAGQLSGGNQQKVAIARAVAMNPRLLILDEPTRGVDVGARHEIYEHLRELAADGMAIVCFTSDMTEVRSFADTVVTLYRGQVVRCASVKTLSDSEILHDILHGSVRRSA